VEAEKVSVKRTEKAEGRGLGRGGEPGEVVAAAVARARERKRCIAYSSKLGGPEAC